MLILILILILLYWVSNADSITVCSTTWYHVFHNAILTSTWLDYCSMRNGSFKVVTEV